MNKIFKVIYSKTRHCYVVVSELAKNQGKSEKSKYGMKRHNRFYRLAAIAALIISAGSLLYPMQAEAWTDTSTNNYFTAYDKNYFDKDGKRSEDWKQVEPSNTNQDKDRVGAKDTGAIAAGMFAQAGQQTVTIGNRNAAQSMGSVFIGEYKGYYNPSGNQPQGLGNNYVTSVGFMSNATKYGTIAIGAGASAKGEDNSVTLGDKDPSGTLVSSLPDPDKLTIYGASVSLGYSAQSEHGNIAIGANSVATAAASTLCTAKFRKDTDGDYNAPSSYISVGSDTVKRRITNVAAGSDANDVATVGQLSYVEQEAKAKGSWKLTAGGTNESTVEAGSKVDFSAGTDGNLSVTKTADSNNVTIGLKKDVTLGKAAQGKGGSLSVYQDPSSAGQENGNDQLGSHVRIDGSTVSIRYQNGTKDSDARGVVLGVAKDSSNPLGYMYLADGNNSYYVHGTMTSDPQALQGRLVYNSSKTGYNYIANLEDGISFSGDAVKAGSTKTNTTADTRLDPTAANHTLSITGGVTDTTKLTSNNIGVVTTPTEYDDTLNNGVTKAGGLTIQLAKDLTDITSITSQTTGSTTGAKVTLDTKDNNIDVNQGKVTNLSDGTVNATSTDAVTGKQLYNLDNSSVKYDTTGTKVDKTKITLAGGATGTTITNVKAGTISANSTDAVNGAQLYAEQQARTQDKTKYYSVQEGRQIDGFSTNENNDGASALAGLAAGYETGTTGIASTVVGSYSGVIGSWLQGAAAVSVGTVNVNSNTDTSKTYSGVANSIVGQANMTTNSNAAIIYGAGNTVTDSYRPIDEKKAATILKSISDQTKLREALQAAVKDSGGQVMVMGGVNTVDKAYMTQVVGVGNTVTGSGDAYDEDKSSQLNYVEGFYTTLTNGKNDYIIGSHNTVTGTSTETNQSNIVFGDNHTLTNTKNNVILGSLDAVDETTVSDVVSIGHNAKVTKEGGVAIGSGSEATTAAGVAGYDPTGATADTTAAWTSKKAAVSVGTADETRQITGVAAGKEETDAVNVAQLKKLNGMKANVNADNIGKNLNHKADGTAVTDEDKTANENDWGAAIGTGSIASDSSQLVTGKTVYSEVRPTADGKYVKTTKTTGENLAALDTQVGTNTGDIKDLKNLKNITKAGQTVIKNLSKDAVQVKAGDRVKVDETVDDATGNKTYTISAKNDGKVEKGNTNLVSGDTVNTAIKNAIQDSTTDTDSKLALKANVDASNIGKNLKESDGITPAMEEEQKANLNQWGEAIGTGSIASDNGQLVTGKTVYEYNKPVAAEGKTLNYVSDTNTTGQNLGSLDAQVGTNTGDISNLKNLSNISSAGETVIKNLAKGSIGMEDGSHTTASHRDVNGVDTYKVDVTVDGQVTENNKGIVDGGTVYNAIQDVKTKTSADLANKANVDASNLTPNNVTKWQEKLGNGKVESGNTGLVTGDTVFKAVDTKANRDGSNLTTDEANKFSEKIAVGKVEANDKHAVSGETVSKAISDLTGDMNTQLNGKANTSLDNITDTGKNVIRDLAKGSVKVIDGTNTTVTTVEGKGEKPTTYAVNVEGEGTVTSGNTGLISGGTAYTELRPADGTYVKRSSTTAANLSALDTGLKNTSSLIHTNTSGDTIHIGETSKASKVDVSSTDANGNKNGRVVTGVVTDAKDANSAANVGYVNGVTSATTQQLYRDMDSAYSRLDNNINRAAAGSNALAALHPLDFDPADKASFAVGYGHYRNANAAAVGAFYQPNANTMVNMGVSLGNGDPGFNAGVSFKIGKGSAYNGVSKAEMAQTIHDQATEISAIKADDAAKDKRIDALEKENQEMKKQIQEILARLNG